jgi:putative glycosyltransferase
MEPACQCCDGRKAGRRPRLSIVTTMYRSSPSLKDFIRQTSAAAQSLVSDDYEIVMVNDGSPDDSLQIALAFAETDRHLVIVDLSRNFGHHKAMMTALSYARGERIFLLDCDMEEDPAWLLPFSAEMERLGSDVVYGVQEQRKGGLFERWSGSLFYRFFNMLSEVKIPANIVVARLMSRRYVDALLRYRETELFMAGVWHAAGFEQTPYLVRKSSSGETTYTLKRKISMLVNSVTSFSDMPLRLIFLTGAVISAISMIASVLLVLQKVILQSPMSGWTSLMLSLWLLGGLIISFLGLIGIYLSKIFSEIKQRPLTIVRHVYRHGAPETDRGHPNG